MSRFRVCALRPTGKESAEPGLTAAAACSCCPSIALARYYKHAGPWHDLLSLRLLLTSAYSCTVIASAHARHPPICLPPAAPYVPALSLYHFFDWRWVSFSSFRGWMVSIATFTNALLAAVYLRLIVSWLGRLL